MCTVSNYMDRFASFVTSRRKPIVIFFIAAAAFCAFLSSFVGVNYKMADYLPPSAQSTTALSIMKSEFKTGTLNINVLVKDVSIVQAMDCKRRLAALESVDEVLWLDDVVDIKRPLEMAGASMVETFYKEGSALFTVTVKEGTEKASYAAIKELLGEEAAVAGEAADVAGLQSAAGTEVSNALVVLLPIVVVLLILASTSWIEPILFLAAIGISILINMGTNIFFGEVSFLTNSVSPILQLAVSLDYAIFLLHSFADHRQKCESPAEAMKLAIKSSFSTIASCAATSLFGFMALFFMQFRIGADLGLVLAKGIFLSFVSVMVFLPALTLLAFKLIDKTKHRPFMPAFRNVNRVFSKMAAPAIIIVALVAIPAFLGQSQTEFVYGSGAVAEGEFGDGDKGEIHKNFGRSTTLALLVPRGDIAKEKMLSERLEGLDRVTSVVSYANQVGANIPAEFLGDDVTSRFYSENYARIIVYTDTQAEGEIAFGTVEKIMGAAGEYYEGDLWSTGQSANLYDMRTVVKKDNVMVTLIAVIAIFIVLLLTFRSATLPLILLLTIEAAIWINLSIPYFTGISINFIGYLVLSTVQLVATVDYAILLTSHYLVNRKTLLPKPAMDLALSTAFRSIIVSAAILSAAGFTLFATATNPVVSDIGLLLGRGALLSCAMVVCFLPGMLRLCDRAIAKTTAGAGFLYGNLHNKEIDV